VEPRASAAKPGQPIALLEHWTEHGEIELERHRALQLGAGMARRRGQGTRRPPLEAHQLASRVVDAIGSRVRRLDQHLAAVTMRKPQRLRGEELACLRIELWLADLQELQPFLQPPLQPFQHRRDAEPGRIADRVFVRQGERGEHWRVRRQHRRRHRRVDRLPGNRLVLARMRLTGPVKHAIEMQPHVPVRIEVLARNPGIGRAHVDAQLLMQLAR
jgi:hypothetical protein